AQQAAQASAPAAPTARRGAADGLDVSAPPGASRNYAAKVRSWLYAHKIYPRRARMRHEEGRVQVRFVIDRAGVLIEGVIIQGSGNGALDEEAAAMMRRASPFPKAPGDVPGERIEFVAPIEFILPV
ncbi:energy transducer TonB, partial [Sphingobium phenoxybenzoativorans]|uniref:energy transducer TonB n=1 Tax=Sphingobium phenoxybenzoativorans TaxID=1592790 RepID=UPI000A9EE250